MHNYMPCASCSLVRLNVYVLKVFMSNKYDDENVSVGNAVASAMDLCFNTLGRPSETWTSRDKSIRSLAAKVAGRRGTNTESTDRCKHGYQ